MKILLLNYTDAGGGAANGALLLTQALNEHGIDATLGVVKKKTYSNYVVECPLLKKSKLKKILLKIKNIIEKNWYFYYYLIDKSVEFYKKGE